MKPHTHNLAALSDSLTPFADAGLPGCVDTSLPLFVDLDGTLTPTDTLLESLFALIRIQPAALLKIPMWLLSGRAVLKARIAEHTRIDATTLPYHAGLLDYLRAQRAAGRRVYLATASHRQTADAIAAHLDLFDGVIASDATCNLKGRAKLAAIQAVAQGPFAYAGDAVADVPIWQRAAAAILVGTSPRVSAAVRGPRRSRRNSAIRVPTGGYGCGRCGCTNG